MAEEIFSAHLEELWAVAADPRGQWIALSGRHPGDRPAQLTLVNANGVLLGKLAGHEQAVRALCAGDGGFLASAGEEGGLLLWKIPELKVGGANVPYQGAPVQRLSVGAPATAIACLPGEDGFLAVAAAVPAGLESSAVGQLLIFPRRGERFAENPSQRISLRTPLRAVTVARLKDVEGREQLWIAAGGDEGLLVTYLRQPDGSFALWRDLTAPTSADSNEGEALWSGHAGAVRALAFHPTVERLLSSGEDGTVRFWYLRGRVSYEERSGEDKQKGGALAMLFGPEGRDAKGEPVAPRLLTAGQDGSVKLWPLDSRRAPKTLNPSKKAVRALAVFRLGVENWLATASEDRTASLYKFSDASNIEAGPERTFRSELDRVNKELASTDANRRMTALRGFSQEGDPEIKPIAIRLLGSDPAPEVRAAAAEIVGQRGDAEARSELRRALKDSEDRVRRAALFALRKLDGESSVTPLEYALATPHADLRREAISLLPPLAVQDGQPQPKVRELLTNGLKDEDAEVRRRALDALVTVEGSGGLSRALSTALDAGKSDIKLEAMRRAYRSRVAHEEGLLAALIRGLENSDADVRRLSFYVALSSRERLEKALVLVDDRAKRAFGELQARLRRTPGARAR